MFLNRPNAKNLFDFLQLSTKQLREQNLLQISMNWQTFNYNVVNLIAEARSQKKD